MTRALLVERDPLVAERIAATLRFAGYEVTRCPGPTATACPILAGNGCVLVEHADVLVYDVLDARASDGASSVVGELRDLYADHPLVLVGRSGDGVNARIAAEAGITHLGADPDPARLALAMEDALAEH